MEEGEALPCHSLGACLCHVGVVVDLADAAVDHAAIVLVGNTASAVHDQGNGDQRADLLHSGEVKLGSGAIQSMDGAEGASQSIDARFADEAERRILEMLDEY